MEMLKNGKTNNNKGPDLNGNDTKIHESVKEGHRKASTKIKDQIVLNDGRVFYPCQFCNKLFSIKKTRTAHIKNCTAKDYILSVNDTPKLLNDDCEESTQDNIPLAKKSPMKIDIHQNIILNEQVDVVEILAKTKSGESNTEETFTNGSDKSNDLPSNSPVVLKEKNDSNEQLNSAAKRLENDSVTSKKINDNEGDKKPAPESDESDQSSDHSSEFICKKCKKEFESEIELLRHSRTSHSYPKVLMALSEIKKFYSAKDRSKCPICRKPLTNSFRSAFVKHLHTHTNEMKFSCRVCNKMFRRADHMKAHEKRHIVNIIIRNKY